MSAANPASPNYNGWLSGTARGYLATARFWGRRNSKMRGYPGDREALREAEAARVNARICWRLHLGLSTAGIRWRSP